MPRNLINQVACDAEPMLGEVSRQTVRRTWLPAVALQAHALDTARWQTRAARGLSWNRSGRGVDRSLAH
jgi:hypothetical protein